MEYLAAMPVDRVKRDPLGLATSSKVPFFSIPHGRPVPIRFVAVSRSLERLGAVPTLIDGTPISLLSMTSKTKPAKAEGRYRCNSSPSGTDLFCRPCSSGGISQSAGFLQPLRGSGGRMLHCSGSLERQRGVRRLPGSVKLQADPFCLEGHLSRLSTAGG